MEQEHRGRRSYRVILRIALLLFAVQLVGKTPVADLPLFGVFDALAEDGRTNIQWFRDEMKISDKYVEQQEGILGMSWAHFFTMIILILFAAGSFAAFVLRYRRTRQILDEIRKGVRSDRQE